MINFHQLRGANLRRNRLWDPTSKITPLFRATELAGEVGEACNVIKKMEREILGLPGSRDTKDHLAEELADVIICVDLLAMAYGIDLGAWVVQKFNQTSRARGFSVEL